MRPKWRLTVVASVPFKIHNLDQLPDLTGAVLRLRWSRSGTSPLRSVLCHALLPLQHSIFAALLATERVALRSPKPSSAGQHIARGTYTRARSLHSRWSPGCSLFLQVALLAASCQAVQRGHRTAAASCWTASPCHTMRPSRCYVTATCWTWSRLASCRAPCSSCNSCSNQCSTPAGPPLPMVLRARRPRGCGQRLEDLR